MEMYLQKIKQYRREKGFSQEYMAIQLELSQVAYTKIENGDSKLSVDRFLRIADILKVEVYKLLDLELKYELSQTNQDNSTGYLQQIENFNQFNKELFDKLIQSKDEQIDLLKAQIAELKNPD